MSPHAPANKKLRVLQVIGGLSMGGAETWLMECLRHWSKTGKVEMDFLCTGGRVQLFDEEAVKLGAKIHYARYGRKRLPEFRKAVKRILADGAYDAIHDHADYASGWHFLAGLGSLPEVRVAHVHNPWLHIQAHYALTPRRWMTAKIGKQLVRRLATHVCGTSNEILARYGFDSRRESKPKISVLHCGFDLRRFQQHSEAARRDVRRELGWSDETKVVLFAGRLDRALEFDHPQNHKNSWFALNVFRESVKMDGSLRLIMAGAGDESRTKLESQVASWGLSSQIRLVGLRRDLPRLMTAANMFFFPSRQEGLGMAAVEAQAAGLPVLASSAVPGEAVVIPLLYNSISLDRSIQDWAEVLVAVAAQRRQTPEYTREIFQASAFAIENSASALERIYGSRLL